MPLSLHPAWFSVLSFLLSLLRPPVLSFIFRPVFASVSCLCIGLRYVQVLSVFVLWHTVCTPGIYMLACLLSIFLNPLPASVFSHRRSRNILDMLSTGLQF